MYKVRHLTILALVGLMINNVCPVRAQDAEQEDIWIGKLGNGAIIEIKDLINLLKEEPSKLKGADLSGVDLSGVNLSGANLKKARLNNSNLSEATLIDANLIEARLGEADLTLANLRLVDLRRAHLSETNLYRADLRDANLSKATLLKADLREARLDRADLSGANLDGSNLSNAILGETNLSETNLRNANLSGATLTKSILKNADVSYSNFSESLFDPVDVTGLTFLGVKGFTEIKEPKIPVVIKLLKVAKESKLRTEERIFMSVVIKHRSYSNYERLFHKYVLLGWLHNFGANPSRCLLALLVLLAFFVYPYKYALREGHKDGIFKVWLSDRSRKDLGTEKHIRMELSGFRAVGFACYFSVLSAFSIGWREINVSNWITRIQSREYIFRATGWTRTLVGIQSLISVYLLALWVLTYFGRPFE